MFVAVAVAVVLVVVAVSTVVVAAAAAMNPRRWCCGFMLMSFLASSSLFDFMFMFDEKVVSDDDRFEKELFECEISFEWGSLCVDYRTITIR